MTRPPPPPAQIDSGLTPKTLRVPTVDQLQQQAACIRPPFWQNDASESRVCRMRESRLSVLTALTALTAMFAAGCNSVHWNYHYGLAMKDAQQQQRRAVVLFATGTNPDCREMDWKVFTDPKVREMMREFVPVRQDFFMNRREAEELGVTDVPTIVVVRPDGSIAGSQSGNLTPEELRFFLIRHRFN
jgi:hypothetical protein